MTTSNGNRGTHHPLRGRSRLAMWRREKGWSQGDLAKRLKVRAIQVSRWERKTSRPTIDRVFALARLFQVEPGEVLQATRK